MKRSLCWIRRDLRLHDHHALSAALKNAEECFIVFIFDTNIIDKLDIELDQRISFILNSLTEIEIDLNNQGSSLIVRFGDPVIEIPKIITEYQINGLFFNRDYEPYAKKRDNKLKNILLPQGITVSSFKDHVFYEKEEIKNGAAEIYKVFTPYKNKWLETFRNQEEHLPNYKCDLKKLAKYKKLSWPNQMESLSTTCSLKAGSSEALKKLKDFKKNINNYKTARDIPSLDETSNLSPYIRFGNLSIRDMLRLANAENNIGYNTWMSEIIWRDFYHTILDAFPHVEKKCFRSEYDQIVWLGKKSDFIKWCKGNTGYPIVDSAMRCLNATGLMHNRLRMVVASFLTKTLLIDWRWGEKYFAEKLLDFDLAANNGGWQWSASTGVDAQPYFRIFNPYNQSRKFDPEGIFIKRWCPELKNFSDKEIHAPHETDYEEQQMAKCFIGKDYPEPIVGYKGQRDLALSMYKKVK